jgi:osmotically-inducible protein OsmY
MINRICASFLLAFLAAGVCLAADKTHSDDAIADQVMIKLAADPDVKGGALKVDCKNGVVTIGGPVDNTRAKEKATRLAKKVKGVKQVVNNLTTGDKPVGK